MSKSTSLKKASIKQLEHELTKRKNEKIAELKVERASIDDKIRNLGGKIESEKDGVVEVLSSSKSSSKTLKKSMAKARVTNGTPLKDLLISIGGDGKARTASDFMGELGKRGWKSTSPKPYYVVSAALASQTKKNVFRRVNKGYYELVREITNNI